MAKKKLKIGIVSIEPTPTMTEFLMPLLEKRGHTVDRLQMSSVQLSNFANDPQITRLFDYDIIYYRTGLEPVGAYFIEELLKKKNIPFINGVYQEHPFLTRKKYQVTVVAEAGVKVPKTLVDTTDDFDEIAKILGTPFIAKADISSQGRDVHKIDSKEKLAEITPKRKIKEYFYQECIPHDCDYRVHLVGGTAVSTFSRVPQEGEFRSNEKLGASIHTVSDDMQKSLFDLAEKVVSALGQHIPVVDFIPHAKTGELYFMEMNCNPGWNNEDVKVSGVNVSEKVADYFESLV